MSEKVYFVDQVGSSSGGARKRRLRQGLKESLPPVLQLVAEWGMRVSLLLMTLGILYYALAIAAGQNHGIAWFGMIQDYPGPQAQAMRVHVLSNLNFAGAMMTTAVLYLAIYAFLAGYERGETFVALGVLFALLHYGSRMLFDSVLADTLLLHPQYGERNYAAELILHFLGLCGDACLLVVLVRGITGLVTFLKTGGARLNAVGQVRQREGGRTGKPAERKPAYRLISRCWETNYCQDYLLSICTAWQKKKTCWKHGSGCLCDSSMLDRLMQIQGKGAAGKDEPIPVTPKYTGMDKCHRCPIYLTHQEEKFRLLSPLALVLSVALIVVYWDHVLGLYKSLAVWIGHCIAALAIGPTDAIAAEWTRDFTEPFVQQAFVIFLCIAFVSYVLKFVEWAVLEQKL